MIIRSGPDFVYGGRGDDRVRAGRGNDRFWGGRGADFIKAGRGADRLNGGPGNDTMLAGRDDGAVDAIDCGSGTADHAVIRTGDSAVNCEWCQRLVLGRGRGSLRGDAAPHLGLSPGVRG
jgi:hypothetical protein